MGLMNKLNKMKSFLFDEEEEEKEEKRPSKKISKKEEKKERKIIDDFSNQPKESIEELYFEDISEESIPLETEIQSRIEKKESEFNFPEFDDDDFMVASKKPEPIIPVVKEEPKPVPLYQGSKRKEETKKFKPSPIISPIYGLLDNEGNKIKEDDSKDKSSNYSEDVTFDEVRKKAYGSLDEEIENTMKRLSKKTIEEAEKDMEKEELSRTKKKSNNKIEEKKASVVIVNNDDDDDDMILPNVNFKEIDVDKETFKSSKKDVKKKEMSREDDDDDDDTKEQDLFNLIDTMYQNKEDED